MQVVKRDGSIESFKPEKLRKWVQWSVEGLQNQIDTEYYILNETIKRLPERVTTEEIHEVMIGVCISKEEVKYSRIAAKLEMASIHKAQERHLGILKPQVTSFMEFLDIFEDLGMWKGEWLDNIGVEDESVLNEWYIELESKSLEFWTVKQWSDKYSLKHNKEAVETPALGCLAISLSYHGVTELAFNVAKDLINYKLNLPTPVLNGCRNDNFNSISCCLMESGDTVDSIEVAEHIASAMTAKKAGIGITLDTRSKTDPVKGGQIEHLGKAPLYMSIEKSVKKFTQLSRGGSATITFKALDPDIMSMLLWKTQRIDISQRIDKVDYNFAYNDSFIDAILNNDEWYLFSKYWAPEVHDNFHKENYMEYVKDALRRKVPHKKVKAIDLLITFIKSRWETGRIYCINLTSTNKHTPFVDPIHQSNLCLEIALPTKPYVDMQDLCSDTSKGETAFCALAALNVANISSEEYPEVAERALRTVERMIQKAPMLSPSMKRSLLKRRSVGIGITGLASHLYSLDLDYDGSTESLEEVQYVSELHYYSLLKASQKMSAETGIEVKGIKQGWLPIDTMPADMDPILDWEPLRGKPRMHSVLVAHMPTESSSLFSSATNSVYPIRESVIYKKARKGKVQFICENSKNKLKAWQVDLVPYYKVIQATSDQAISADYHTDFTKYPGKKVPVEECIEWFIRQAKAGIKTAYYQNFKDGSGKSEEKEESCEGGACKL